MYSGESKRAAMSALVRSSAGSGVAGSTGVGGTSIRPCWSMTPAALLSASAPVPIAASSSPNGFLYLSSRTVIGVGAVDQTQRPLNAASFTNSAGLLKPDTDWKKAYTTKFVNQGHGLELRKKLTGE